MQLNRFDLNLLIALDALLHEKNVTRAAERVFVSQPAMSAALQKLREYFNDQLLVRIGRDMELTPRGLSLVEPVREALLKIQATLGTQPSFEPETVQRTFSLIVSADAILRVLPQVLRKLAREAPGITCHVEHFSDTTLARLESGDAGPAVELGRQRPRFVGDGGVEHAAVLDRVDRHRPDPALDDGFPRAGHRADDGNSRAPRRRSGGSVLRRGAGPRRLRQVLRQNGRCNLSIATLYPVPGGYAVPWLRSAAILRRETGGLPGVQQVNPALHVKRDDRGGRVGHLADHGGDLVSGAVMQQPPEQRRIAAPRQHHRDLRALRRGLATY